MSSFEDKIAATTAKSIWDHQQFRRLRSGKRLLRPKRSPALSETARCLAF